MPSNVKRKRKRLVAYTVLISHSLTPLVSVILPVPTTIERLSPLEFDKILNHQDSYPQIADIFEEKVDKIVLTDSQVEEFTTLALLINDGSITMKEAVLRLRGGDGLTGVVAVIAFVIFVNWYDSLFGVEAFQANPLPHQDPFGWLSGKYDSKNAGNGQCLYLDLNERH